MKKLTAVMLLSVGALLAACGKQEPATQAAAPAPAAITKIVVGLDDNFPPMGFRDEKNELVGFDIDMAREAAQRMGVEVDFKPIDWSAKDGSSAVDAVKKDEAVFASFKELKTFGDNVTALMDLATGRLDAVVVDEVVGRYYVAKKPADYAIIDEHFGTEDYGVGVRKGDTELHGKLDKALADMKADGTSAQIATKWFGKDIIK